MRNPFAQIKQPHQLTIEAPQNVLDVIELRAEEVALAITRPIDAVVSHMILIADEGVVAELRAIAEKVGKQMKAKVGLRDLALEPIDWVRQVQKDFPPFKLGRFYVYGTHVTTPLPKNSIPLLIDAAAAFGTGEHETTAGCLLALAREKKKRAYAPRILDMGCGTAILAVGAGKLWKHARITACDNDAVAVDVSRINLRANRVQSRSSAFVSDGYKHRRLQSGRDSVIVANILAVPLMRMAHRAAKRLAPGGTLILSGLLNHQEMIVLSAYRAQGLYLEKRIRRGKWSVLILRK
jgi:ribosomal protein L11 methyltransferase